MAEKGEVDGIVKLLKLRGLYYKDKTEFKKPWGNVTGEEYTLLGWDAGLGIEKPFGR